MNDTLSELDITIAALARASDPSEVFRLLLEGSRQGAPRTAVFLVRHGRLKGWSSQGYPPRAASGLRGLALEEEVWLGRALDGAAPDIFTRQGGEDLPDVGQPPASEAHALPVRVADRAVAVLLAERGASDPPCSLGVLRLLVTVSRLKLELDLTWRKLRGKPAVGSAPEQARPPHPQPSPGQLTPPALQEPPEEAALAPVHPDRAAAPDGSHRNQARRFARLVATDIRLYNEEAVMLGRRHRDLAHRLGDQLEQGEKTFSRRFGDLGKEGLDLLREAYVEVLAAGDPGVFRGSGPS